ncbi:MAG: ATP-binding protein [Bdellovibrionales bacterium]|nr:ATP-binding protein [Bdellovibrionales bacterium]
MKDFKQEKDFWFSSEGFLGQSFSFKTLDLEIEDNLEMYLDGFLKIISPNVRVKISLFQEFSKKCELSSSRIKAISEKGFLKTRGLIHFEHRNKISPRKVLKMDLLEKEELFTKQLSDIKESKDNFFLERLKCEPLSSSLFNELYTLHKPLEMTSLGLKSSFALLGILKLKNSGNFPLTLRTLPFALEGLPKPLGFHISLEKISPAQAERILQSKSREEAEGRGQVSFEKYQNTQKALSDVALAGEELFHFEAHITLRRLFEDSLRKDIILSLKNLSGLGEWSIESFGAYPSLLALSPGSRLHYRLIEKSSALKCFIPFLRFGASISEEKKDRKERAKGNLLYHRRDLSLDALNPFSEKYSNHTGVIVGKSGKGKSVFANLLTRSLFHDKKATIFLVDVKGSHKRTVRALKGKTYNIDIKNTSGLNPLRHLTVDKDSIEIASHFLEKLFLKENEEFLPSDDKTKLENNITRFSKSGVDKTLDNFYNTLKHDRKDKLLRWIKGSLNENIFNSSEDNLKNRLLYFN